MLTLAIISMGACASDIMMDPRQTWQALFYAALAISILITTRAEQIAARDHQKEMDAVQQRQAQSRDDEGA